jgi:hypothetical protein
MRRPLQRARNGRHRGHLATTSNRSGGTPSHVRRLPPGMVTHCSFGTSQDKDRESRPQMPRHGRGKVQPPKQPDQPRTTALSAGRDMEREKRDGLRRPQGGRRQPSCRPGLTGIQAHCDFLCGSPGPGVGFSNSPADRTEPSAPDSSTVCSGRGCRWCIRRPERMRRPP